MTDFEKPQQKVFTGVWLPVEILSDANLKPVDRILYAEIASFGAKGCWKRSTELQKICGVMERAFQSACKRLEDNGYITQKRQFGRIFRTSTMSFKQQSQNSGDEQSYYSGDEQSYYSSVHIDNTKEHIGENTLKDTKVSLAKANKSVVIKNVETSKKQPVKEIIDLHDYWQAQIGYPITSKQKLNRYACNNLLKKFGVVGVQQLIRAVQGAQEDKYAPAIADFIGLQSKLNDLLAWAKKKGNANDTTQRFE